MCLYACLNYPGSKAHLFSAVLYCHMCPVWLYLIFPHYLINGTIFGRNVTEHKMCVLIITANMSEIFLIRRRIERDIIVNVHRFSCKVPVIFVRLELFVPYFNYSRDAPTGLTFNNCTLCPHCIYVFCIYLRTNSDLCHLHYKLIGFYNRDEKCLQRSTDWICK